MLRLAWVRRAGNAMADDPERGLLNVVQRGPHGWRLFQGGKGDTRLLSADRAYPSAADAMFAAEDVTPPEDPEAA